MHINCSRYHLPAMCCPAQTGSTLCVRLKVLETPFARETLMTESYSTTPVTALLDVEPGDLSPATCPLCHTTHPSMTHEALAAGGSWVCARCGQRWHAQRLLAVSRYAAWVASHG